MGSKYTPKQSKTANLYRERRIQHRYHKKGSQYDSLQKQFQDNCFSPPIYPENMKTLELKQTDDDLFSDNRIKHYHHVSTDSYHVQSRLTHFKSRKGVRVVSGEATKDNQSSKHQEELLTPQFSPQNEVNREIRSFSAQQSAYNAKNQSIKGLKSREKSSNLSISERKRYNKKECFTMDVSSQKELPLSLTAFSLKPNNTTINQPRPKSSKYPDLLLTPRKVYKKDISSSNTKQKKKHSQTPVLDRFQKSKFQVEGWQNQNASFNEFDEFYIPQTLQVEQKEKQREVKTSGSCRQGRILIS